MPFELIDILLLLASAQGLFLTILIFHRHRKLYANQFLSLMILGYSLVLLHLFLDEIGASFNLPWVPFVALGLIFIIGPLHYLYSKYLTQHLQNFQKRDRYHFIPLCLYYLAGVYLFVFQPSSLNQITQSTHTEFIHPAYLIFNWFIIFYSSIYVLLTFRIIKQYRLYIHNYYSSTEKIRLGWLLNITWTLVFALSVFIVENILYLIGIDFSNQFTLSSSLFAVYIYVLGYIGLFKSEILQHKIIENNASTISTGTGQKTDKYGKSGLSQEKAFEIEKSLKQLMDSGKPYLNSDLTLNQLADQLNVSPHNLSEVINTRFHCNFFDFINAYRIEKVKQDLKDTNKKHLKVLAIAMDAGFNSKSTFNIIFKKQTHMTPSQYRDTIS